MKNLIEKDFGLRIGGHIYAKRSHLRDLFKVPTATLKDNINALKKSQAIKGNRILLPDKNGHNRKYELYNLKEVVSIALKLKTPMSDLWREQASKILLEAIVTDVKVT